MKFKGLKICIVIVKYDIYNIIKMYLQVICPSLQIRSLTIQFLHMEASSMQGLDVRFCRVKIGQLCLQEASSYFGRDIRHLVLSWQSCVMPSKQKILYHATLTVSVLCGVHLSVEICSVNGICDTNQMLQNNVKSLLENTVCGYKYDDVYNTSYMTWWSPVYATLWRLSCSLHMRLYNHIRYCYNIWYLIFKVNDFISYRWKCSLLDYELPKAVKRSSLICALVYSNLAPEVMIVLQHTNL